jgi:hypothetical protein
MSKYITTTATSQVDNILRSLLNRVPSSTPALLHGYKRFAVQTRKYPAIIPADEAVTDGLLLHDITSREMQILDNYGS